MKIKAERSYKPIRILGEMYVMEIVPVTPLEWTQELSYSTMTIISDEDEDDVS